MCHIAFNNNMLLSKLVSVFLMKLYSAGIQIWLQKHFMVLVLYTGMKLWMFVYGIQLFKCISLKLSIVWLTIHELLTHSSCLHSKNFPRMWGPVVKILQSLKWAFIQVCSNHGNTYLSHKFSVLTIWHCSSVNNFQHLTVVFQHWMLHISY